MVQSSFDIAGVWSGSDFVDEHYCFVAVDIAQQWSVLETLDLGSSTYIIGFLS